MPDYDTRTEEAQAHSELKEYRVELTAMVQASYRVTVSALDPEQAMEAAKAQASNNPTDWDLIDGGFVENIAASSYMNLNEDGDWIDVP